MSKVRQRVLEILAEGEHRPAEVASQVANELGPHTYPAAREIIRELLAKGAIQYTLEYKVRRPPCMDMWSATAWPDPILAKLDITAVRGPLSPEAKAELQERVEEVRKRVEDDLKAYAPNRRKRCRYCGK